MLRAALLAAAAAAALAAPDADAFARSPAQRARIAALRETQRLRDAPPVGGAPPQYLDGEDWIVTSADGAISTAGSVPGDLITDLQLGGLMGDPIYVRTPIGRAHGAHILGAHDLPPFPLRLPRTKTGSRGSTRVPRRRRGTRKTLRTPRLSTPTRRSCSRAPSRSSSLTA